MPAWLLPALKAILPHVGTIISTASPVFTKRNAATRNTETSANQAQLLQQQITELQAAATENAAHIRELAEQLQTTVAAIEQAASVAEANLRRVFVIAVAGAMVSLVSLGLALSVVMGR